MGMHTTPLLAVRKGSLTIYVTRNESRALRVVRWLRRKGCWCSYEVSDTPRLHALAEAVGLNGSRR